MAISLTERGEEIAKLGNLYEWVKKEVKNKNLKQTLGITKDTHPYDIQESARKWIFQQARDDMIKLETMNKIKDAAYEKGESLEGVYSVIAVILRDELMK